jgi:transcriptional regulator with XRE-family HTH domain
MPDHDYLIGPVHPEPEERSQVNSAILAFGTLVRLERRLRKLSVAGFAQALDVEAEEIRRIEHDVSYRARPRTIVGIAKHFKLPPKEMMKLAGAAVSHDTQFIEKAMRFAAHSDDMGGLSEEEHELLNSFVNFLRDKSQ